jgi:small subunit ribosomal protein S11
MAEPAKKTTKKRSKRIITNGRLYIKATFNNTLVSVADESGNVITTSSSGAVGFRGSKKGTGYAAQVAAEMALGNAVQVYGLKNVEAFVNGVGQGRDSALRATQNAGVNLISILDTTKLAHGGVRLPKRRKG